VREFALPSPLTGSIDLYSGFGRGLEDGSEIHRRIQEGRLKENSAYESEVSVSGKFENEDYIFEVDGRLDGFTPNSDGPPTIEEIKSAFNVWELSTVLKSNPVTHPYCLQLLTYGYIHYLENKVIPKLSFHLVSSRNSQSFDQEVTLDLKVYKSWLKRRLAELALQCERAEKRTIRRVKAARKLIFPFENPRQGQMTLVETIENGFKAKKRLLIQAPTGLGKTVGVLYPTLKEALGRGQRVVYVTPKNSQHGVAEDAVERLQETGAPIKSLTITAKSKMCFKAEPLCNPSYCEFARDYYDKLAENDLIKTLSQKKKLSSRVFKAMGEKYEVCPFELQLDAAEEADTVICDYNYVFAPRSALGKIVKPSFSNQGKPNLIIDEAHNLPARTMSYYSPGLSSSFLESLRPGFMKLPKRFSTEGLRILDECLDAVRGCKSDSGSRASEIHPDLDPFLSLDAELREYLTGYLNSDVEIEANDPVLKLSFYWGDFTAALEKLQTSRRPEFFVTFQSEPAGDRIQITCCDASEMIRPAYDDYSNVVGFSATLKPFDFYAKLSGLEGEDLETAEFKSPFEASKRKLLIIPQISTRYSNRERNYGKIAETISRIIALKSGNYFAFFPSFAFLERVSELLRLPSGFQIVQQGRGSRVSDVEALLESLRTTDRPKLVLAVQGGVFSEGVDYPGKMLIGAFVIGPPLPVFDVEREGMRKFYEAEYGKGFDYAYTYPAMAKTVQAAGRVIRSEKDSGVIVLMDDRFLEPSYAQSMPGDWFEKSPKELVSTGILKEIADFWKEDESGEIKDPTSSFHSTEKTP
jgi:DNA excision repair protein ERCC-2